MYRVELVRAPTKGGYAPDYFPRKIRYKETAVRLKEEVEANGGEAIVKKVDDRRRD